MNEEGIVHYSMVAIEGGYLTFLSRDPVDVYCNLRAEKGAKQTRCDWKIR